ncbi:DUF1264 domain-containing protein [Candidatus Nitrosocosmicus sp. R]
MNNSILWSNAPQSKNKIMSITLSILLFSGIYVVALSIEEYNTVQAQGQSHNTTNTATPMNANQANATSANATKPVDGYGGPPTGPLNAVRHVFDEPTLRVYHFCKPNDKIMMVCQLYDSSSPNATLIGVEYMIDSKTYQALPDREKPNWHYHKEEFSPDRANPKFPLLNDQQQKEWLVKLSESYGKVILNWNPMDILPAFPPQIQQVQHPFMVNQTVSNNTEKYVGSFNQTLDY